MDPNWQLVEAGRFVRIYDRAHARRIAEGALEPGYGASERDRLADALLAGEVALFNAAALGLDPVAEGTAPTLSELLPDPAPNDPGPRSDSAEVERMTFVELCVRTEDGITLADVPFSFDLSDGRSREGVTDQNGVIRIDDVGSDGLCRARLASPVELPPARGPGPVDGATATGTQLVISPDHDQALEFSAGRRITVIVERPGTHLIELEDLNFAWNRYILLPDFGDIDENAELPVTARAVLRTVLRFAESRPHKHLLVVGHTDTDGSAGNNLKVSDRRAKNVFLYLSGDRDGWAAQCHKHHEVADWQAILAWVARTIGWNTDPGPVDNDFGDTCAGARKRFRETYNSVFTDKPPLKVSGSQSEADWAAFFDVYDRALARVMHISVDELAAMRGSLQFVEEGTLACGEHQPQEAVGQDGFPCRDNRRVDILFFEPGDLPDLHAEPPGAGVYQGGYKVVPLSVPGVGSWTFRVVDETETPVAAATVTLRTPAGDEFVEKSDVAGVVHIDALFGDEFEVLDVCDGNGAKLVNIAHA